MIKLAIGILGFLIVALGCFDVLQTIVVPRLTLRRSRIAPFLISRILWPTFRRAIDLLPEKWRTAWLEIFAPLAFVTILIAWLTVILTGFSLLFFAIGDQMSPPVYNLATAYYFAGTALLTLGFGDVVPVAAGARFFSLLAAVIGLMFMALLVSLLFSTLSYFQERERVVNTLMSRAGLPPSGVVLLMRYKELGIVGSLATSFVHWETWLASILESHRSFPLLLYFRSSSPNNSWMATAGATLDAASIILTSIDEAWVGEAELYYWMGVSSLKAIAETFNVPPSEEPMLDKSQFVTALDLLHQAGFKVRDAEKIWPYFQARRSGYMRHLIPLSMRFETPAHVWMPEFKSYSLSQ